MSPKGGAGALQAFPAPLQLQLTHPVAPQDFYRPWRAAAPPHRSAETRDRHHLSASADHDKRQNQRDRALCLHKGHCRHRDVTRLSHHHGRELAAVSQRDAAVTQGQLKRTGP